MLGFGDAVRNQRGVALVVALLVLLVLSLLAAVLMSSINVETKVSSHSVRESQALNTAEAGVAEAVAHIRNGDVLDNNNPRMVAQIFNVGAGSVPALGPDSIGMPTAQPVGAWLDYSRAEKAPDVLTVKYKTDPGQTVIYRYDETKNPPIQTVSGLRIFSITSVGRRGRDARRIDTDVIQKPFIANVKGALAAKVGIDFSGNSDVCGYNHSADTPAGTKGRPPCDTYETGAGDLPGSWSEGTISSSGSSTQNGSPVNNAQNQAGFYAGPWEALGMTQAEFFSWVGPPVATEPATPQGIFYLDNNAVAGDVSGAWAYHGGNGEGMMYVDGDMTINGNFNYRGLLYIEGDLKINGTCWILGGIIVKGKTTIKIANGDCTVLYSSDAITQNISKYGGQFVTLSWRETTP